tara:strand:+ start:51 stop:602 length:552 start_codon:yes stop_codon:yes gene_type:complete
MGTVTRYGSQVGGVSGEEKWEVFEDTLSRERVEEKEWKERHTNQVARLTKNGAPECFIEQAKFRLSMTKKHYNVLWEDEQEQEKQKLAEYMVKNPLKEDVVKKLFDAFDKIMEKGDWYMVHSNVHFLMRLDPLKYVDKDEFYMGVYDGIIDSLHLEYSQKWGKIVDLAHDEEEAYLDEEERNK